MEPDCIFCKIAAGAAPAHVVWEDDAHMAFLSIFPNTDGVTVVIPKKHRGSYAFALPDDELAALMRAAKTVAGKIDRAFSDVGRTALVFEGFGVDHLHAKLFPMHGTADMAAWRPIESKVDKFFDQYEGYISSHDFERADDQALAEIAARIRETR